MMNNFDSFILRTGFGKMIISKMITRFIKEHLGKDVNIGIGDVNAIYKDGTLNLEIDHLSITAEGNEVTELLKL